MKIFAEQDADEQLKRIRSSLRLAIENEQDTYTLNVNEETLLDYLVNRFTIEPLEFHLDELSISTQEKNIPAEHFPNGFFVNSGKSYKKDVITYHIPFTGDRRLLGWTPNPRILWTTPIHVSSGEISFEIINFQNAAESIKQEAERIIDGIMSNHGHLHKQIMAFNNQLKEDAKQEFSSRKTHLLQKNNLLASLGVPVRAKPDVPNTFSVPAKKVKPKISINKPVVKETGYAPEPTLDEDVYNSILQIIYDVGKEFERLPSTYSNKSEEQLRDHFLLMLEPNFEGTATGETFNKKGKTDILLRHEGSNIFIAECKFWKGEKVYLETINQLLGYLTWRDSKAAVILFVKNKGFTSVLNTIDNSTSTHNNFLKDYGKRDETWFRYGIHLDGDPNREVKTAVLVFHIPEQ